jgi:hypothetical protein
MNKSKYGATAEEFERWERERLEMEAELDRRQAEREELEERRRRRLQRLSFGLLGR